jgi:hypothetical protein
MFDQDWMCRALKVAPVYYLHAPIALFRLHDTSKTVYESTEWDSERCIVAERYWKPGKNTQTALSMYLASAYLQAHNWNRSKALKYLRDAIQQRWFTLVLPKFWILCLKAILPLGILKKLRALRSRLFSFGTPSSISGM